MWTRIWNNNSYLGLFYHVYRTLRLLLLWITTCIELSWFIIIFKWPHLSAYMHVKYVCMSRGENGSLRDAVTLSGQASWFLRYATAVRSRHSGDKKVREQKGGGGVLNIAAKDYHFNMKRMLSQHSHPFNCDTIQLLITRSKARRKVKQKHNVY